MAAAVRERFGVDATTTPGRTPGEFKVFVDGKLVIKKRLPFLKPGDEKVLEAVGAALG